MIAVAERDARTGWSERARVAVATAAPGRVDQPLTGLSGSGLVDRFRSWQGRSGRRYVFSVFHLDGGLDQLPVEAGAVVIAAVRQPDGTRRKLWVAEADRDLGGSEAARLHHLAALPGCELHLHLLASTPAERRAIVDDLRDDPRRDG